MQPTNKKLGWNWEPMFLLINKYIYIYKISLLFVQIIPLSATFARKNNSSKLLAPSFSHKKSPSLELTPFSASIAGGKKIWQRENVPRGVGGGEMESTSKMGNGDGSVLFFRDFCWHTFFKPPAKGRVILRRCIQPDGGACWCLSILFVSPQINN